MHHFCVAPLMEGFGISAGLIIAIGAQNAFVLKQGLLKNHVFATASLCAFIDAALIVCGVNGFGRILTSNPYLLAVARWGGAAFLFYYGLRFFRAVLKAGPLANTRGKGDLPNLKQTITTVLALTLLNPHVYLDTVVLVGSIGAQFPAPGRPFFILGAVTASLSWFFGMGFGARYLTPLFQKPFAWKVLDFLVGCMMWGIALTLIFGMSGMGCKYPA